MTKLFLTVFFLKVSLFSYSQATQNCDQLKSEIATLREENNYLRTSLKLNEALKEIKSDNIIFKLLKLEGDAKAQTVTAILTLRTSAANWYIMSSVKSIIDIEGNEYKLKAYQIGASDYFNKVELNTDVPIKCSFTFDGVLSSVKVIKLFKFAYAHEYGQLYAVDFRDLSITWK